MQAAMPWCMRVAILCLTLLASCADEGERCPVQPQLTGCTTPGLACSYAGDGARSTVCTCDGYRFACSSCGDFPACAPGDSCSFSDWERDCDCSCDAQGWVCTPFYQNYGCPYDVRTRDAGIDAATREVARRRGHTQRDGTDTARPL